MPQFALGKTAANIDLHNMSNSDTETDDTKQEVLNGEPCPKQDFQNGHKISSNGLFSALWHTVDEKLIRNFLPAYFVNVMATGICLAILYNFPYPSEWLKRCLYAMYSVCVLFFFFGVICFIASCFRGNLMKFHTDPATAPFMGCIAMGYNLMVNMIYFMTKDSWIIGIYVLWWILVVFCIYTAFFIFYFTFLAKTKQKQYTDPLTFHATLLLPIVALTVTSSAGQLFVLDLPRFLQPLVIFVSYILWANAMAMSFIILTLVFYKYMTHKIPATNLVFTTFIPIGFLGQGAFSILLCGDNLYEIILANRQAVMSWPFLNMSSEHTVESLANVCFMLCTLTGLFLISFGYFNTFIAVTSVLTKVITSNPNPVHVCNESYGWRRWFNGCIKFHKGYWAITFPLGTMAIGNAELGKLLNLEAFKVIGAIYGVSAILVTVLCCLGFIYHVFKDIKSSL